MAITLKFSGMNNKMKRALKSQLNRSSESVYTTLNPGGQARWYLDLMRENRAEIPQNMKQNNRRHTLSIH